MSRSSLHDVIVLLFTFDGSFSNNEVIIETTRKKWFVHSTDLISLGRQINFEKHTLPNKKRKLNNIVMLTTRMSGLCDLQILLCSFMIVSVTYLRHDSVSLPSHAH